LQAYKLFWFEDWRGCVSGGGWCGYFPRLVCAYRRLFGGLSRRGDGALCRLAVWRVERVRRVLWGKG
jgi:hypothetical protein